MLFLLGLVFMPVTSRMFRGFDDNGWMFSKVLAAAGIGVAKIAFLHVGEDGSLVLSKLFSIINWKAIVLALAIWYGLVKWKKHPIFYIVAAAVIGIVFQFH